jgi:acetyl-CoA synthetase
MTDKDPIAPFRERVEHLLATYGAVDASAAKLLCDRHDPTKLAYYLVSDDQNAETLSYRELKEESERFAAALSSLGIVPGDRVATLLGKGRPYIVALMGIWRLGAVHVPLFTAFAPAAIAYRLYDSGAKLVICDSAQRAKLRPCDEMPAPLPWRIISTGPQIDEDLNFGSLIGGFSPGFEAAALGGDAPLIHIFTSGTTGKSKGVVVPIRAMASFQAYAEFALDLREDDLYWCAADPGWAYGLYFGILSSFSTGTPSLLLEGGFSPEITMSVLASYRVTNFAAAPTVYRALRAANIIPQDLALRCASSAGEPLTPDVNMWAETALGLPVHDHYGQTECGMLINNHHHPKLQRMIKPGFMGHVMPGWSAVVLDLDRDEEVGPGETGRVAMVMRESPLAWFPGYFGDDVKTAEKYAGDGRWYLTGDIGSVDRDGYFSFSSRDDDVIIMAGYRIGPFEIESVLSTHEAVSESAVIAVPDAVRGEVMEAFVTLSPGYELSPQLADEIKQWVKTRYAAHAYPRKVHFTDALPKTPSGKVQRFVLKQQRIANMAADAG